jgi:hypothetical protein
MNPTTSSTGQIQMLVVMQASKHDQSIIQSTNAICKFLRRNMTTTVQENNNSATLQLLTTRILQTNHAVNKPAATPAPNNCKKSSFTFIWNLFYNYYCNLTQHRNLSDTFTFH